MPTTTITSANSTQRNQRHISRFPFVPGQSRDQSRALEPGAGCVPTTCRTGRQLIMIRNWRKACPKKDMCFKESGMHRLVAAVVVLLSLAGPAAAEDVVNVYSGRHYDGDQILY